MYWFGHVFGVEIFVDVWEAFVDNLICKNDEVKDFGFPKYSQNSC